MDTVLALVLVLLVGGLIWLERERLRPFVARPASTPENGTTPGGYYWTLTRQAGLSPFDAWPFYMGAKIGLALILLLPGLRIFGLTLWTLLLAATGFMLPDIVVAYMRRQRRETIRRALSFFLDLLVSLLQAGLGVEEAFSRTAQEGLPKGHPLADEARRVVEELRLGRDRSVGFQLLADRTGVVELRAVSNALSVALTQGSSLDATLKMQADVLRAKRREEGLKRLNVANAQILFPLMLCGFPVFVVLVFVPLAIRLLESLTTLGSVLRLQ